MPCERNSVIEASRTMRIPSKFIAHTVSFKHPPSPWDDMLDLRRGGNPTVGIYMALILSSERSTTMGTFSKFLVRTSELMVALTLKIRAM